MIDERFSLNEGGLLKIDVGDANVEVEPGASDEVHVVVIVEARDRERGKTYFEQQNFDVSHQGSTVRVETNAQRNRRMNWRTGGTVRRSTSVSRCR